MAAGAQLDSPRWTDRLVHRAERYEARLRAFAGGSGAGATTIAFLATFSTASLAVAVIRVVQSRTVELGGPLGLVGLAPGAFVTAASLLVLSLSLVQIHRDPESRIAYAVALLASIVALAATIELFAGVFTVLWPWVATGQASTREPNLWTSEQFVIWQIANAVPLLDAPNTLGWEEPSDLSGALTGSLIVALRILLVVPLLRIAVASYSAVARHVSTPPPPDSDDPFGPAGPWPSTGALWRFTLLASGLAAVAYATLPLGFTESSPVYESVSAWARSGLDVGEWHLRLTWLPTALQVATVCLLLLGAMGLYVLLFEDANRARPGSLGIAGAVALCVAFIALATAIAAAALLALLQIGLGETTPALDPATEVAEALTAVVHPVAVALPVLDIPGSFRWHPRSEFTDPWTGGVRLAYKLFVLLIVFVPLMHLLRLSLVRNPLGGVPPESDA